ncbi:hypothetical protein KUCAC02_007026, partial [Chaenocephalus aceratus]
IDCIGGRIGCGRGFEWIRSCKGVETDSIVGSQDDGMVKGRTACSEEDRVKDESLVDGEGVEGSSAPDGSR